MLITCADTLRVGSNGSLAGVVNNGDGTATTHWKERYPIDTYLISIAVSNYRTLSNWFLYAPADSMEVLNYVLPSEARIRPGEPPPHGDDAGNLLGHVRSLPVHQ